jgi:hypothetical protein
MGLHVPSSLAMSSEQIHIKRVFVLFWPCFASVVEIFGHPSSGIFIKPEEGILSNCVPDDARSLPL